MNAITWMETTARNPKHGYDQRYRWGERGDYDCSSAVITAWEQSGIKVKEAGATYTGNMYPAFIKCGFKDVTNSINLANGKGLRRGDVLLNVKHHTAMYCGNNNIVQASINEKGNTTGGIPGDQTGREFWIRSYYNYPWNYVLRYESLTAETKQNPKYNKIPYGINKRPKCTGVVTADVLNVRMWAGVQFGNIKNYPVLKYGNRVDICSKFHDNKKHVWFYVRVAKKYFGFVDSDYIRID